jgi:hypothetical protein
MRLQLRDALMSIRYEFQYRHSSKIARYSPKDNISDYIKFIRSIRKETA